MFQELIDNITNVSVFTESISDWVSNISINSVIIFIMMIFMLVGAIDKIRGNKKGYGEQFDEGFNAMGPLAASMAGVVAAAPVLAIILKPIIVPIYSLFGADASMFATTLLACDMGGYPLAIQLAGDNAAVGNFAGLTPLSWSRYLRRYDYHPDRLYRRRSGHEHDSVQDGYHCYHP